MRIAIWLLRCLCPGRNHEALAGDLLEQFREGRSMRWVWRQVLIAIAVGVMTEVRLRRLQIGCAVVGTAMSGLAGMSIARSAATAQVWVWSRNLPWPFSAMVFDLGQAALLALSPLPAFAALMLWKRTFRWPAVLYSFAISFPMIAAGSWATSLSLQHHLAETAQAAALVTVWGVSWIFITLLLSISLVCRPPGASAPPPIQP